MNRLGIAGRIANGFIRSKLTPLIVIASLLLGIFAVIVTPREEEPQILVPMIDVFVSYPGASAKEVQERVTKPMEKLLWEIKGVEYVYSMSKPGMSLAILRFYVGEDMEDAIVKVYNKLMSNYDRIPPGVSKPIVKPRSIDDVPILAFTLWSKRYPGYELRRIAYEVADELKKDRDVSEFHIIGGERRAIRIDLDPLKLRAYRLTPLDIMGILKRANFLSRSGSFPSANSEFVVETGGFIKDISEIGGIVVAIHDGKPVFLKDVSSIVDGPEEPSQYVFMGFGRGGSNDVDDGLYQAVTISIAKKKGTNAINIANRLRQRVDELKHTLIPSGVEVTVTRNYGETAKEKSDTLLEHMLIAAVSVTILVALALGIRASLIVLVAVPVTLALTILVTYLYGYTLNRVTLFALIFSIGILVDDAIVVVENIHRHFKMHGSSKETAVAAVDEVGNPTILATFTVIAALLPMAFVSGLMGPYMRPIPVGASAAMVISLLIAFIISPWLSFIVLKSDKEKEGEGSEGRFMQFLNTIYEKNLRWLLDRGRNRFIAFILVLLMLGGAVILIPLKLVTVKMLPFDNKSEFQVILDMPEGTTLEETSKVAREIGAYLGGIEEVSNYQVYVGTAAPFNFNGLVRHYFLRSGSNVADIQVNLIPKEERKEQSHGIAKRVRPGIKKIVDRYHGRVKVVEIPPGPPVLSTLVVEVYGPDFKRQVEIAKEIRDIFDSTDGVVDVDWYVEDDQKKLRFEVDRTKAALNGIDTETVAENMGMVLGGGVAGLLHVEGDKEPVVLRLRADLPNRSGVDALGRVALRGLSNTLVPLSELVKYKEGIVGKTIYRKNLKRVVYVVADVAGTEESPVYAILKIKPIIDAIKLPEGYRIKQYFSHQPESEERYSVKWDGEWQITYEVFRDLGIAFAAVLVLIYIMVVGWFGSFLIPVVIMAPIPLSLIGILPAHALMGAFFTATSMIGFIAGAGIVVRNSIILVDFIELKLSQGMSLKDAVVQAGLIRFRPMLLTASAVVVGSSVILFDPIFQGMAISLMAGEVAATLISRTMVPVLFYMFKKGVE